MNKMKSPLRIGQTFLDIIEIYIPSITFLVLFVVLLVQIFYRYFLVPLTWPLELSLFCYIWTILFSVGYGLRDDEHISFDLIYDVVNSRGKTIMRVIGDALIVSSFIIALYPSYKYVVFMGFKHSDALGLPMDWVYAPYMVFMVIVIGRFGRRLVRDIQSLIRGDFK
jgi:TRAP-type C4-dicarboxylate transport system permease small subunit